MSNPKSFTLSKKTPTLLSLQTAPVVVENSLDVTFAASGNLIKVFSLRTGLCIKTLRRAVIKGGV
jgi:hypothetical protein